jgi:hypothetical protein
MQRPPNLDPGIPLRLAFYSHVCDSILRTLLALSPPSCNVYETREHSQEWLRYLRTRWIFRLTTTKN